LWGKQSKTITNNQKTQSNFVFLLSEKVCRFSASMPFFLQTVTKTEFKKQSNNQKTQSNFDFFAFRKSMPFFCIHAVFLQTVTKTEYNVA
jgi:hypothetical protein